MASRNQADAFNTFGLEQPQPTFAHLKPERERLPVTRYLRQFEDMLLKQDVIIVSSGTGSGKTTQIPQYIAYLGRKLKLRGRIACTQPRRLTATQVARRVAEEAGCQLGAQVGYQIRGEDRTSEETQLMYVHFC